MLGLLSYTDQLKQFSVDHVIEVQEDSQAFRTDVLNWHTDLTTLMVKLQNQLLEKIKYTLTNLENI